MKKVFKCGICILCMCIPYSVAAAPIQLSDEGKIIKEIESSDYLLSPEMDLFIDWEMIESLSNIISKSVTVQPKNASLNKHGEVISGKSGVTLDKQWFQELVGDLVIHQREGRLEIPKKQIYPEVDNELIEQIKSNKIGTFATYFKRTNKERSNNIELATEAINNYVIFPGEEFSFNKVVGERTKERGYMEAPVIVKGELSEGVGGGICQVSSTLYNAVDIVGLNIVKRYSHSRSVPYVPPGRDATVSWFGPDFVFKNPYDQPILIRAFAKDGNMIVTLYSSDSIQIKRRDIPELEARSM